MESIVSSQRMKQSSNHRSVERAQPWLGTVVSIRVAGMPAAEAQDAINAAFEEVAAIHGRMSFHDEKSEVSRLNRCAFSGPVQVHRQTLEVLQWALLFSSRSEGCFDISVGGELVDWNVLPRPSGSFRLPKGSWRDIEIGRDGGVFFHRPLWIDLGGIAKGYAVDCAIERLLSCGVSSCVVNAGGDIRVAGRQPERIALGLQTAEGTSPVVELSEASIASSDSGKGRKQSKQKSVQRYGPHVHGIRRSPVPEGRFVCVIAERCVVADSMTKVVLAEGRNSGEFLKEFGASAYLHDSSSGWEHLGSEIDVP